jgi:hypothetical protein
MDTTQLIEETLKLLPMASAYITTIEVSKVIGQEVVKESVKKLYNWVYDKCKIQQKEKDVEALIIEPENLRLQGKVASALETILVDENAKTELMALLKEVETAKLFVINRQESEKGENEIEQNFEKIDTPTYVENNQTNKEGKNKIKQTFGKK